MSLVNGVSVPQEVKFMSPPEGELMDDWTWKLFSSLEPAEDSESLATAIHDLAVQLPTSYHQLHFVYAVTIYMSAYQITRGMS